MEEWAVVITNGYVLSEYLVSDQGRFYSCKTGRYFEGYIDDKGYVRVTFTITDRDGDKKRIHAKAHRVVLESFGIQCPENCDQVDHINGKKNDNYIENLEWVDSKTNVVRSWETGLHDNDLRYGEFAGNSKYTEEQIKEAWCLKKKVLL